MQQFFLHIAIHSLSDEYRMSTHPVYRICAQVAPSAEYLRGHGRVAVDVTALRHLWQH